MQTESEDKKIKEQKRKAEERRAEIRYLQILMERNPEQAKRFAKRLVVV